MFLNGCYVLSMDNIVRNMRTAVASISSDSSVNKLSVSSNNLIAVPYDNRNVRIFDLNGSRLARLPRSSHQGHSRMVTATAWAADNSLRPNLFTCGFDRQVMLCSDWLTTY